MNKSYFLELADYNIWANNIVHGWLKEISEAQWSAPIVSSFGSLEATALHIAAAESIWLDRLQKSDAPVWLPHVMNPNRAETLSIWKNGSQNLKVFVQDIDDTHLSDMLSFKRISGEKSSLAIYHVFAHVFNHSTYHRGQILTMLRQVGYEKVGSTDMLVYFRK